MALNTSSFSVKTAWQMSADAEMSPCGRLESVVATTVSLAFADARRLFFLGFSGLDMIAQAYHILSAKYIFTILSPEQIECSPKLQFQRSPSRTLMPEWFGLRLFASRSGLRSCSSCCSRISFRTGTTVVY